MVNGSAKKELAATVEKIDERTVEGAAQIIIKALKSGKKIMIAGNGGSAADSQHFAGELVCTFGNPKRRALRAISLNTNSSIMTAWANDFSFEGIFERQVCGMGEPGDVLFSITTSGNSPNISNAMKAAKERKITNILLGGKGGGKAAGLADFSIIVPSESTPRIQECHIFIIHEICRMIDKEFEGEK